MTSFADLRRSWENDPEFRAAYVREYPHAAEADMLLERRASLGLSQRQYAARFGVSLRDLRRWESGQHPVPPEAFA